jgi:hypothetical protein
LRLMITLSRTIFRFICSTRNVMKFISTNFTICFMGSSIRFVFARSRTVFEGFYPISRNINFFTTCTTFNIRSFHHASN